MTIALVSRNQSGGATATQTISLTVAALDVLVMMVHFNTTASGSLPTLTITDSAGNTWNRVGFSQDNGTTGGNYLRSEMWVAVNKTFAGSNTATLAFSASLGTGNATYQFVRFSGVDNNFPVLDGCTFTADYTGSNSNPGNTQLVSLAGAMSVAMCGKPGAPTFSTPTNYSVMGGNISSTASSLGPFYRLETAAGTDTWSTGDSFTYWAAGSLTLRPAGTFKASATPALRNSAFVGGGTTGSISSGAITTAANDYMLAVVHFDNHTAGVNSTVTGISDANGTPWAKLASSVSTQTGQFQSTEIWGAVVPASGTTPVTVTIATSGTRDASSAFVGSFSGVDTSSPIAMPFSFVTNYTASAVSLTPSGTLQHGDIPLLITGYQTNDNTAQETLTSTTGWTTLPAGSSGSSCQKMYDQVEGTNGVFANSATFNAGDRGAAFIGALRAANSFLTALDGSATNSASAAASVSATLTTTKANDAVVAVVYNRSNKASPVTCSSITGTNGLTWTLRSRNTVVSSDTSDEFTIEVFYAIAASALSGKTIVANMSASCDVGLIVFGVSGVNTTTPWDASGSFNNKNPNSSPQTLTRLSPNLLSTTNADDFVFAMAVNDVSNAMSVGSIAGSLANALGTITTTTSSLMQFGAEYLNFATALSGKDAIFQAGNSSHWLVVSDALTAGPSSTISPSGTITTALTKPALALVGKETFKGTINTALSKANLAASGTSRFVGTITMNLSRVQMALAGKETFSGSIATHLQGISQHLTAPGNSTGAISMTLPKTLLAAVGEERFIGTINTALRGFNVAQGGIVAREIFVGSIHTNLSGFVQIAGVAEERFVGTIRTRLGTANTLVTTDVKGLLIILGDIYTNLYPPDLTLLGAKIGAPGQGQWYSYRYLDSGSS